MSTGLRRLCVFGICSLSFFILGCPEDLNENDAGNGGEQDTSTAEDTGEQQDTEDQRDDTSGNGDTGVRDSDGDDDANGGGDGTLGWAFGDVPAAGEPTEIADVEFVNDSEGWLIITAGDEDYAGVWYTDDGGETWSQRHSGQDPASFAAAGENGPFWFGTFSGNYKFWSSESGNSFSPIRDASYEGNPNHPQVGPEYGQKETADAIELFDADNALFTSNTAPRVQYTDDGGKTWYSVDVGTEDVAGLNQMDAVGDEVWIAGGESFGSDNGEGAYAVRSTDRGKTWSQEKGFVDNAHSYAGGSAEALYIADDQAQEIWVGGEKRQLYYTEDGGSSWNQISGISDKVRTIWNLHGAGDLIVGIVNTDQGSGILQSEDGGENWELVVNREDAVFYDVEVVNEELAFAYPGDDPAGPQPGDWLVFDYHNSEDLIEIE